jgi:hypothetical protein
MDSPSLDHLLVASADLVLAWSRRIIDHFGPTGSLDLDLDQFPDAEGPSYYNQFAHWPLLLLSEGVLPGATDHERQRFRDCALGNIAYLAANTDEQFHLPHYSRGRDWGRHLGEWANYFMLRSLQLVEARDLGSQELRHTLARNVHGAAQRIYISFSQQYGEAVPASGTFPGNHAVWHALLCYEAGQHFGEAAWMEFARGFFRRHVLATQEPNGCWPEGGGIVVNYGMVTAQALSVYAEGAADAEACLSVARFQSLARFFALPDGSSAVAADCRMRYSPAPMIMIPPTFLRSIAGRQDVAQRISGFRARLEGRSLADLGAQGLAFFALLPDFLAARGATLPCDLEPGRVQPPAVARLDRGAWTALLSWQLNDEAPSRFLLDAQNFVELRHDDAGYLVGGGNSKYMPRFSTIRRCNRGRPYMPDAAGPLPVGNGAAAAAYRFGATIVEARVELTDGGANIGFRLDAAERHDDQYEVALMLDLTPGDLLNIGGRDRTVDPAGLIEHRFGAEGNAFTWRGITFRVPPGTVLNYPLVPHNPYRQDGLPEPDQYMARLALILGADEAVFSLE